MSSSVSTFPELFKHVAAIKSLSKAQIDEFIQLSFKSTTAITRAVAASLLVEVKDDIDYPKQLLIALADPSQLVRESAALTADPDFIGDDVFKHACSGDPNHLLRAAYVLQCNSLDYLMDFSLDHSPLVRMLVARRIAILARKFTDQDRERARQVIESLVVDHTVGVRSSALEGAHVCGFPSAKILRGVLTDSRHSVSCEDILTTDSLELNEKTIQTAWAEMTTARPEFPANVLLRRLQIVAAAMPLREISLHHFTVTPIHEARTLGLIAADMLLENGTQSDIEIVRAASRATGESSLLKKQLEIAVEQFQNK